MEDIGQIRNPCQEKNIYTKGLQTFNSQNNLGDFATQEHKFNKNILFALKIFGK